MPRIVAYWRSDPNAVVRRQVGFEFPTGRPNGVMTVAKGRPPSDRSVGRQIVADNVPPTARKLLGDLASALLAVIGRQPRPRVHLVDRHRRSHRPALVAERSVVVLGRRPLTSQAEERYPSPAQWASNDRRNP